MHVDLNTLEKWFDVMRWPVQDGESPREAAYKVLSELRCARARITRLESVVRQLVAQDEAPPTPAAPAVPDISVETLCATARAFVRDRGPFGTGLLRSLLQQVNCRTIKDIPQDRRADVLAALNGA